MNDISKRSNTVIVRNTPPGYTEDQLFVQFSDFGHVSSAKIIPPHPPYDGGCGFVNYDNANSCKKAVDKMNNVTIDGFLLFVSHAAPKFPDGTLDRSYRKPYVRSNSGTHNNQPEEKDTSPLPSAFNRVNKFRPASEQQLSSFQPNNTVRNSSAMNISESETNSQAEKPLWSGIPAPPSIPNHGSPLDQNKPQIDGQMSIATHEPLNVNQTYEIYLSNCVLPNVIFAATLDDYVCAALLLSQMNKQEKVTKKDPANSYKSKLVVGQICAAIYRHDWYRARVLEVGESRVHVQFIDWGTKEWCDSTLGIRPLSPEYYKDPALCIECILDGVPPTEKLSDRQRKALDDILVLDRKLSLTVLRMQNGKPYVQLTLDERNLNEEVCTALSVSSTKTPSQPVDFPTNMPDVDIAEIHYVQLTYVDPKPERLHVILMRDCLVTIMNTLKDWNAQKQPFAAPPQPGILACAQYRGDDLWYRVWIDGVVDRGYRVYFVDFGNEEIVPLDCLNECPAILQTIPWQSVQIKLANIQLNDEERRVLLRQFETERLEMKIVDKKQNVYHVELTCNGKSLRESIVELRKKNPAPVVPSTTVEVPTEPVPPPAPTRIERTSPPPGFGPVPQLTQPIVNAPPAPPIESKSDTVKKLSRTVETMTTEPSAKEGSTTSSINDNLTTLITEQRRQNRLLERIAAGINTTNALLTQLVQRDDPS